MRLSGSGYNLGYNAVSGSNSRVGLPVASRSLLYSHYKHVHGYSVKGNSKTVPISKIRILNNIIDNLVKIKRDNSIKEIFPADRKISSESADKLIESYAEELHRTITAMNTGFNSTETGLVVSLTA